MATKMVRRVGAGALAATAGALAPGMVSQANAAELPGLGDITDLVAPLDNKIPAPVPAPLPLKVADTLENALPANLLRRNSLVDDNTERANTDVPTISGDQVAAAMNRGAVAHKVRDTLNQFGVQVPGFDAADLDASGDPNVIGQLAATGTLPNAETLAQLRNDLTTLVSRVTSGDVLRDAGQAIDETLHSDEYAAWRASGGLDTINESLSGDERAVNGISTTIDAFTTNPAGTLREMVDAAGGPAAIATDPVGSVARVLTRIVGPDAMVTVRELFNDGAGALLRAIRDAAPTLLTIPAGTLIGALATGLPGLLGSAMLTIPMALSLPLALSAASSILPLLAWSIITFGPWILAFGLLAVPAAFLLVGPLLGFGSFAGTMLLAGFNPIVLPGAIVVGLFMYGAGVALTLGAFTFATAWIPIGAYLLGVIPALILGALMALATLAVTAPLAWLIPLIGIPLLTLLSALPGALLGTLAGSVIAALLGGALFGNSLGNWWARYSTDPDSAWSRLSQAVSDAWNQSALKALFDELARQWGNTATGMSLGDLARRLQALSSLFVFLDNRRLQEMIARGAILGGLAGLLPAILAGIGSALGSIPLTFLPNLALMALLNYGPLLPLMLAASALSFIPPFALAIMATVAVWLIALSPIWVPLLVVATIGTIVFALAANPIVMLMTFGLSIPVAFIAGGIAFVAAAINLVFMFVMYWVMAAIVGVPVYWLTLPLFSYPALAMGLVGLLLAPLTAIEALGLSTIEAGLIGLPVGLATGAATVPAGAILGALAALLTHLRAGGGVDGDTGWFDGRILNHGGFGDILSGVPGLSGNKDRVAVPEIASPNAVNPLATTTDRSLADVTALV